MLERTMLRVPIHEFILTNEKVESRSIGLWSNAEESWSDRAQTPTSLPEL